ncbi:uncharacterized protein LOC26514219 isoform X4 [Drosophila ananassae]|uniref:uncharacterized protein LOC26514219 isoform X4 n=1 Tax=Drosophila ananassae TaxID=7217 RepID=UPI001D000E59|nr:uncharacterized protein LOC26514219 isoform X4 [Drosophila ananassae]
MAELVKYRNGIPPVLKNCLQQQINIGSHKWCTSLRDYSRFNTTFCLAVLFLLVRPIIPEAIVRVDPLATTRKIDLSSLENKSLLAATLRTHQRAGCDFEVLLLSCPRGTSISIELAQYGRAGDLTDHSLCPSSQDLLTTSESSSKAVNHMGTDIKVNPSEICNLSGLQYSLLQTVVDHCQKKQHCKFAANSKIKSIGNICDGVSKFIEISYKCRPYEFRSKVACENDTMPLMCNPYSRIAIYSASFGHLQRGNVLCGQSTNADYNRISMANSSCLVSYATETTMQICHGRRRCTVVADTVTFGRPCVAGFQLHLKVVYTCIPRKVLKDRYETLPEPDEPKQSEVDLDEDEIYDEDQFYKESEAIPPSPKLQGAVAEGKISSNEKVDTEASSNSYVPTDPTRDKSSLKEHQKKFYLYLIISVAIGLVLLLMILIWRITIQKRYEDCETHMSSAENSKTAEEALNVITENQHIGQEIDCAHLPEPIRDYSCAINRDMNFKCQRLSLTSRNKTAETYLPIQNYRSQPPVTSNTTLITSHPHEKVIPITKAIQGPSCLMTASPAYVNTTDPRKFNPLQRYLVPTHMEIGRVTQPPHFLNSMKECGVYYDYAIPRATLDNNTQHFDG